MCDLTGPPSQLSYHDPFIAESGKNQATLAWKIYMDFAANRFHLQVLFSPYFEILKKSNELFTYIF